MARIFRLLVLVIAISVLAMLCWTTAVRAETDEVDSIRFRTSAGSDLLRVGEAGGKARALAGESGCRIQTDNIFNEQIPYNEGKNGYEYNITVYKGRVTKIERVGRGY